MSLALHSLMKEVVDYAGLFPPAALRLGRVVANYADYLQSPDRWMLGRLIIPIAQLADFATEARPYLDETQQRWHVSCLLPRLAEVNRASRGQMLDYWRSIARFNQDHLSASTGAMTIDAAEIAIDDAAAVALVAESLAVGGLKLDVFLEMPIDQEGSDFFHELTRYDGLGLAAKIRTGGMSADLFPPAEILARFIWNACQNGVAFKATAGLHHPLRSEQPISYEPNCSNVIMHGFLNVALAATIARSGELNQLQLTTLLDECVPQEIQFEQQYASWRGLSVSPDQLRETREQFFRSFGSCSFIEPVEDLQALGYLPLEE